MLSLTRRSLLAGAGAAAVGAAALPAPALAKPFRGIDRIASVAYIEANDNDISNVGRYLLQDGSPAFDIAVIFAANINYDGQRAYLHCNENVQQILDSRHSVIRPLQDKGIKVLLSVLGNHQGAGLANFPDAKAADDFAKQVTQAVRRYGLDGVDLDDEWSKYGENGTGQPNEHSFINVVSSLRKRLPNRLITYYRIGPSADALEYDGVRAGDIVDYAWNPYYGAFVDKKDAPVPGLPDSRYGAAAIDLSASPDPSMIADFAQRTVDAGYGAYVTYQLQPGDQSDLVSEFTTVLYGSEAVYV